MFINMRETKKNESDKNYINDIFDFLEEKLVFITEK